MNLLIIGATGLVGNKLIYLLEESDLAINKICFIASNKSKNKLIKFKKKNYLVKTINDINLNIYTHACVLTSEIISKQITPSLLYKNIIVIDNSSAYRKSHNLTIPEINFRKNQRLYINPNCCVIQSIIPLFYINNSYPISKITYNTYQSCSGGGNILLSKLNDKTINKCIPFIGKYNKHNYTAEEFKLINETKKLLNNNIDVYAHCVRVPVNIGHLIHITIETNTNCIKNIEQILKKYSIYYDSDTIPDLIDDEKIYTLRLVKMSSNTFSFYTYSNNLIRGASYNTFLTLKYAIENNN